MISNPHDNLPETITDSGMVISDPSSRPPSLRDLAAVLKRHFKIMALIVFLAITVGTLMYLYTDPIYRSQTSILVEGRTTNTPGQNPFDPVTEVTLPTTDRDLLTQIEVLRSTKLTIEAYRSVGFSLPRGPLSAETLELLLPAVTVEQAGSTNVLHIKVDSSNPDLAYKLAQTIPTIYLDYVSTTRQAEVDNALTFLSNRLVGEREALRLAELERNAFKQSRSLLPLDSEAANRSQQVSQIEASLASAEASVRAAKERLKSLQKARLQVPETRDLPSIRSNIEYIQQQQATVRSLRAQREALLERFAPDHPDVRALDAQIASLESAIAEAPTIVDVSSSIRNPELAWYDEQIVASTADLRAAEAAHSRVREQADTIRAQLRQYNSVAPQEAELSRNVDERQTSILATSKALEELRVRRNSVRDPVTILSAATAPAKFRPRVTQYIGFAFVLGLILSVAYALLRESLDDKLYYPDEANRITSAPVIAQLSKVFIRKLCRPLTRLTKSDADLLHSLRSRLIASSNDDLKSFLVTSVTGSRSSLSASLGIAASYLAAGKSVCLVDAGYPNSLDLMNLLRMETTKGSPPSYAIAGLGTTPEHGQLEVVASSGYLPNQDSLDRSAVGQMAFDLSSRADIIIYVTCDLARVPSALLLADHTDALVLSAELGATTRTALRSVADDVGIASKRIHGLVLLG